MAGGPPFFVLLESPQLRVPHPCVLGKGGNLGPIRSVLRVEDRDPCRPPFRTERERMGHPPHEYCQQRPNVKDGATRQVTSVSVSQ
jgi:hypothetical protein